MYKSDNLGLNITEMDKDGNHYFNFDTDLNQNFLAIDNLALSTRYITNCITKIQQDIKLELVDGILSLKKGSKLYVPNRFEADGATLKFDEVVVNGTQVDGIGGGTNKWIVLYNANSNGLERTILANCVSGSTRPTLSNYGFWYDTTNNVIERYVDNAWDSDKKRSLPLCIITITNNVITSIDQVFNGFGFVGSTYFALPGVKCLIPNGRNKDGSLNNIEHVLNTVQSYTITDEFIDENAPIVIMPTHIGYFKSKTTFYYGEKPSNPSHHTRWYDVKNNYWWEYSDEKGWVRNFYCVIGGININNTIINSFTYKNPFKAVDFNDYQSKITELETKIATLQAAVEALQG